MTYKNILKAIPTIHAAQLVTKMAAKKKKKKLLTDFTDVMVGTTLIQTEADFIGGM